MSLRCSTEYQSRSCLSQQTVHTRRNTTLLSHVNHHHPYKGFVQDPFCFSGKDLVSEQTSQQKT